MKRRKFLQNTAAVTAGLAIAPGMLKGTPGFKVIPNEEILEVADDNILIIIELFGGNDGLNTIVPADNDNYYTKRPVINIPKELLRQIGTVPDLYMHPALVDNINNDDGGMMRLMNEGRLAIVQGIGYDNPNLSHFRSEDIWLSGINSSDPSEKLLDGWLGRYFAHKLPDFPAVVPEHPLAVQLGGTLSMLFKSPKGDMGIALDDPDEFYELGAGINPYDGTMDDDDYYSDEFNFINVIAKQSKMYAEAVKAAYDKGKTSHQVSYSEGLSQKMKTISALIAGGLKTQVYFVKLSNFDSHAQQQNEIQTGDTAPTGQHATLLADVSTAICEFLEDAQQQGFAERIVGFTFSEMGRRTYDNGSRGTDHGAASVQFVFGGHSDYIQGGVKGSAPVLVEEQDIDDLGNLEHQFDYRRTYAEILRKWLGASEDDVTAVFNMSLQDIGLIVSRGVSVSDAVRNGDSGILVYPNPNYGDCRVKFELRQNAKVDIRVYNVRGDLVFSVSKGMLPAGYCEIPMKIAASGSYICNVIADNRHFNVPFSVVK